MSKLIFWGEGGTIKLANKKYYLNALGPYLLGHSLERLEWALATIENASQLAPFLGDLRLYEQVHPFEDIGKEARGYHEILSNYTQGEVSEVDKNNLREVRVRWDALIRERLQSLYLVTPETVIDPKKLIGGIQEILPEQYFSFLEEIEVHDLNEACSCLLMGSPTAGEHIALRAAENLLRRWYECKTGKSLKYKTWGAVLNKLVTEYPNEAERPKEIAFLGYLKHRRDEVAHPERISSLTETAATLMNICSLIERIEPVMTALVASSEEKGATNRKTTEEG